MKPNPGTPLGQWIPQAEDWESFKPLGNDVSTLMASWIGLLQDSPVDGLSKPHNVAMRWIKDLQVDWTGTVSRYKSLAHKFFAGIYQNRWGKFSYTPLFREFAKTPIFREYHSWRRRPTAELGSWIYSFLVYASKAPFANPQLEADSKEMWLAVEQKLSEMRFNPYVLDDLKLIIDDMGITLDPLDFVFKHGPGTVSDVQGRSTISKQEIVGYVPAIQELIDWLFSQTSLHSPYMSLAFDILGMDAQRLELKKLFTSAVAELLFVLKDVGSMRSISRESASYQYAQQGVLRALTRAIDRSWLGKSGPRNMPIVDINSQENNRLMAVIGAASHEFDTTDLSMASDSVHIDLVRGVFSGILLKVLLLTRSSLVDVGNDVLGVYKFAPMGSAVCFPVQCILFSAIVTLVTNVLDAGVSIREYLVTGPNGPVRRRMIKRGVAQPVEGTTVYGDDIITHRDITDGVMVLLSSLGFVVNHNKSFVGDQASRESCGKYVMDTQVWDPVKYQVDQHLLKEQSYEVKMAKISLANELYRRGWFNARNAILRTIPRQFWLYGTNTDLPFVVLSYDEKNIGVPTRWNRSLQRLEIQIKREITPDDRDDIPMHEIPETDRPLEMARRAVRRRNASWQLSRYELGRWYGAPSFQDGRLSTRGVDEQQRTVTRGWTPVSQI